MILVFAFSGESEAKGKVRGEFIVLKGNSRSHNTLVEFPSYQAAVDYWNSVAYQQLLKLRLPVSTIDLVIVEDYDGPQP